MEHMSSIELSNEDKATCHKVARDSIRYGLEHGVKLPVDTKDYSTELQKKYATFVTLHKKGDLRGCIGALEAYQPLIDDIAEHAYAAAFSDPRFPSLEESEFDQLDIEISVLSSPEEVTFTDEADLLNKIRPGIDGLILEYGYNRGTFLPSVWEQLPDKKDFLNHLKMKAGLAANWWDDTVKISRYKTLYF
jgi:AmmeMemoRadiSam system protein A